jgi:hypothetical protein
MTSVKAYRQKLAATRAADESHEAFMAWLCRKLKRSRSTVAGYLGGMAAVPDGKGRDYYGEWMAEQESKGQQ